MIYSGCKKHHKKGAIIYMKKKNLLRGFLRKRKYVHHCSWTKEEMESIKTNDILIYKLTLNNGLLIVARIRYGIVRMEVYESESEKFSLEKVSLQGMLIGTGKNTFVLQELMNKNSKIEKMGVATYMLRLLLTWIADYNETVSEEEKIRKITGTINPLDYSELSKFKKFFLTQDKLTDLNDRISLEIDKVKCEESNIYYDIV